MTKLHLTSTERVEFDKMLRDVIGDDAKPKATTEHALKLLAHLEDAEQAHRGWAERVMREATVAGLQRAIHAWVRAQRPVTYRSTAGAAVSIAGRAGVKREGVFQLVLFEELTADEIRDYSRMIDAQLVALGIRRSALRLMADLMADCPEAATVGDALAMRGVTLDQLLDEEAA